MLLYLPTYTFLSQKGGFEGQLTLAFPLSAPLAMAKHNFLRFEKYSDIRSRHRFKGHSFSRQTETELRPKI